MNLISCGGCGVVLDLNKLKVEDPNNEDGTVDTDKAVWDGETWVPKAACPVCGEDLSLLV